jgi:hypothetical protein
VRSLVAGKLGAEGVRRFVSVDAGSGSLVVEVDFSLSDGDTGTDGVGVKPP